MHSPTTSITQGIYTTYNTSALTLILPNTSNTPQTLFLSLQITRKTSKYYYRSKYNVTRFSEESAELNENDKLYALPVLVMMPFQIVLLVVRCSNVPLEVQINKRLLL